MSWLGSLLVSLFGSLATFFAQYVTKKTALTIAALAVFLGLTTTFAIALKALLVMAMWSMPGWMAVGAATLVPSNLPACVSVVVSARIARWIYDYHVQTLKIASYIT